MKKLKIGNIIKTAWSIYRSRFKEYYRLALTNSFWIFVPVYGWAKYAAMMGLLARLAYGDVAGNSETTVEAKRYVKPKTWLFFGAGLMSSLVFYIELFAVGILLLIVSAILTIANPYIAFSNLFGLAISILSIYSFYWIMSHLFLYELPLAVGKNTNVRQSRDISWKLATESVLSLQIIIFGFFLVYGLFYFLLQVLTGIIDNEVTLQSSGSIINSHSFSCLLTLLKEAFFFFGSIFVPAFSSAFHILGSYLFSSVFNWISYSISELISIIMFAILNIAVGALFIPFWQSLKAVAYYQLNLPSENTNRELNYS